MTVFFLHQNTEQCYIHELQITWYHKSSIYFSRLFNKRGNVKTKKIYLIMSTISINRNSLPVVGPSLFAWEDLQG